MTAPDNCFQTALVRHPESSNESVQRLEVHVHWLDSGALRLRYTLRGDLRRLAIPPPAPPRRAERLWEHTCCEIFLAIENRPGYHEYNFSPSGEWAAYVFQRYRDGGSLQDQEPAPIIDGRRGANAFELDVMLVPQCNALTAPRQRLRVGLCAVIEDNHGALSYWALKHPPGKPDFHHPDAFALTIELPPATTQTDQ